MPSKKWLRETDTQRLQPLLGLQLSHGNTAQAFVLALKKRREVYGSTNFEHFSS